MADALESILVVHQNPVAGRLPDFDQWYTDIHIRDALRLEGAIATQRFCVGDEQPVLDGEPVTPAHWAHTIYEWESAQKSVDGHNERAGTSLMEISRDGAFEGLRDFFYRPEYLSHGWSREAGFRRGTEVLTALLQPPNDFAGFLDWFETHHAPATLALPGFESAGVFSLHECQSLPFAPEYPVVAIYGLSDRSAALKAWAQRHNARSENDLSARVDKLEIAAWQPRIERLRAEEVANPSPEAAAREAAAREKYAGNYLSREDLSSALASL
ncbi:hypothetical protein [Rhizorhabdus argentea]|uniref:hypothetical protein n=1 Tax=Rhizorhabdus argentea TaxID=1387174 RepID=UPI0030ED5B78